MGTGRILKLKGYLSEWIIRWSVPVKKRFNEVGGGQTGQFSRLRRYEGDQDRGRKNEREN